MDAEQATRLGSDLRAELAGWTVPLMAVQTTHSFLRGTSLPSIWGHALRALHGGASGPWAVLADHDDLLGLPQAMETWGRDHLAVGAVIDLPGVGPLQGHAPGTVAESPPSMALLLAPTASAYRRLCLTLSHHLEDPSDFARLLGSRSAPWDDLVLLIDDPTWALHLHQHGAEVWWRSGVRPSPPPPVIVAAGIRWVAAPLLRHLTVVGQRVEPVLTAIREKSLVPRRPSPAMPSLMDLPLMRSAYAGHEDAIDAGIELLARCRYVPGLDDAGVGIIHMPPSPHAADEDADAELARLVEIGLFERYGLDPGPAVRQRLDHEMAVIRAKRFAGYILTVHDLAKGRRTCGRGSGASSLVVYCLGITNVDPVRYNLMFERFLAPERSDPPDIDVDFPWDERDAVIQVALERYGCDRAALVATHQTLKFAGAVREAARAHGLDDAAISVMRQQFVEHERFGTALDVPEPWPAVLQTASLIAGGPRHLGVHCGGVIITEVPIRTLVPVHAAAKAIDGVHCPCVAWEKDGCELLGLVKIDLLGNRSLAVVRDCLADLTEDGIQIHEHRWRPEEDPRTKQIVAAGGTFGCFYIESPAMRALQAKVGSGDFDRLVVHSSIIRPAANKWIAEYIKRHHHVLETGEHRTEWYPHPALQGLLSESYGVLSYQEDVMLVCQRLAGFGSREANIIRKALGKPDAPERLRTLAPAFFAGCTSLGVEEAVAATVWDMISSFAGYSFCKAHSASFAMVSFQCAFLKAHHPAYFLARVIANQGGYYSTSAYLEEARRLGVVIRGPCVIASVILTRREGAGAIRIGLHLVPGLSQAVAAAIIAERVARPFRSLTDLMRRCHAHGDDLQRLLDTGALDALLAGRTQSQRNWLVAVVGRRGPGDDVWSTSGGQQAIPMTIADEGDPIPPVLPTIPSREVFRHRLSVLGFLPEAHPLTLWDLPARRMRCRELGPHLRGRKVTIVGFNITRKQVTAHTKTDDDGEPLAEPRDEAMAFVTIEDETGLAETTWFPEAYRRFGVCLERPVPVQIRGRIEVEFGQVAITVESAESISRSSVSS